MKTHCPNCNIQWQDDKNIYEFFLGKYATEKQDKTRNQIKDMATEMAAMYGCTKESPKHFGVNVVFVASLNNDYYHCNGCGSDFDIQEVQ